MNDGKSLRILGDWIGNYFHLDKYGSLIPSKDSLRTESAAAKVSDLFSLDHDLERDLNRRIFSTDVEFAWRPKGSSPVIAGGIHMFGPSPLRKLNFKGKVNAMESSSRSDDKFLKGCEKRERRIEKFIVDARNTLEKLQPTNEAEEAIKEVEMDQVLTGGGYDNTKAFQITESLLDFLSKCADDISFEDSQESEILMRNIVKFKEELYRDLGVQEGSLRITSFMLVRMMQESDGMLGFPVMKKSSALLDKVTARRVSMWTGVDCRWMGQENVRMQRKYLKLVNADIEIQNKEKETKIPLKKNLTLEELLEAVEKYGENDKIYLVVDAMCYCLDRMVLNPDDAVIFALIWTLARIQRHGYKEKDGELEIKKGKARSVSPNGAFSGAEEAMVGDPFIKLMKEKKVPWMPSLQDRETADSLIWNWYESVLVPKGMRALPADWSGYDKTVKGAPFATILYYVVRPLFHFDDQKWVDLAIVSLIYKYFFINVHAASASPELWNEVQQKYTIYKVSDDFAIVGTYNGLGSGAKLTHVGGSLYGELIIHHCIPDILGYEGVSGPQAGDDTSLGVPEDMIDLTSAENTYQPISDAAARYGLELNAGKQMWVVGGNEVVNIFLQYNYNYNLKIKGVGTAVRYYVAYPFTEREKFLSIGEQYMAVISKFNNGVSNPWIEVWITKWFEQDNYICAIFKEYGVKAFNDVIVASTGSTFKEISERLEITYNWGLTQEQLAQGDIPVLPILADVASRMFPKVSAAEAMSALGFIESQIDDARRSGGYNDDMDIDNDEPVD